MSARLNASLVVPTTSRFCKALRVGKEHVSSGVHLHLIAIPAINRPVGLCACAVALLADDIRLTLPAYGAYVAIYALTYIAHDYIIFDCLS